MPTYLDCNATTPLDPAVREVVLRHLDEEFGNAGSRTHAFGTRAKQAVERARDQVAAVVASKREEVLFTSGATESNNLAILGLAAFGLANKRTHVLTTAIEHKAVLEPLEALGAAGFEVEVVSPNEGGWVDPSDIARRLRQETLLVSVMHVNNETGVIQPISELARALEASAAFLHIDAAQGFGKEVEALRNPRVDLISISGHKLYAPKGVGALIARRRGYEKVPLKPLTYGGGQERGLRPGTLPVHLIAGLGMAAELALRDLSRRSAVCAEFKQRMLAALQELRPVQNGDPKRTLPNCVNLSFPGIDAEAAMVAVKDHIAISNGSACTSSDYKASHVLSAMRLPEERVRSAVRISWCHLTQDPDWQAVVAALRAIQSLQ